MLKPVLLFSFFFIAGFVCAQVLTEPSIVWQRCYGGSGTDHFRDAIVTSDGGVIAIAEFGSNDGFLSEQDSLYYPATLMKFDAEMNLEWVRNYGGTTEGCGFIKIFEKSNGNFIIAGVSSDTDGDFPINYGSIDIILIEVENDGDKIWAKNFGSPGTEDLDSFIPTLDGGYLLTASSNFSGNDIPYHYGESFTNDAIIFKTDSAGNLSWVKVLGGSNSESFLGDPVEIKRGMYILNLGSASDDYDLEVSPMSGVKRWVFEIDSVGNITKENFISAFLDIKNGDLATVYKNKRIEIIGIGNAASPTFPSPSGHLIEEGAIGFIDTGSLELVDLKKWGGSNYDAFKKYCIDENGNYYFLGISKSYDFDLPDNYDDGEDFDYWLMSTDSNFNLLWSRNFGGGDDCGDLGCSGFWGNIVYKNNILYAFIKNVVPETFPDSDINCGHPSGAVGFGFTDAWIVAFDLTTALNNTNPPNNYFSIYPVPANDILNVDVRFCTPENINVSVSNLGGQVVYAESMNNTFNYTEAVNVSSLPAGMYIVQLRSNEQITTKSFVIAR
ncbi:MAG: T9SS type A sorting domain-containing protein [Fimbriimonadaceae bacterium]|nr:T9SS type A sorting domain-containing protein [Chitinophagales bacterium]